MATIRVTSKQIKEIKVEDKTTWPVDLEVWIDLSAHRQEKTWDAPFYLSPEQVKTFRALIKKVAAEAAARKEEKRQARLKKECSGGVRKLWT
jgi:hypothetical protein